MFNVLADFREWSDATFGTEKGPIGPLKHLIAEAQEAMANPSDATEFADCLFLVVDAAHRAGHDYDALHRAMRAKLAILKTRRYERTPEGEPSFHVRERNEPET